MCGFFALINKHISCDFYFYKILEQQALENKFSISYFSFYIIVNQISYGYSEKISAQSAKYLKTRYLYALKNFTFLPQFFARNILSPNSSFCGKRVRFQPDFPFIYILYPKTVEMTKLTSFWRHCDVKIGLYEKKLPCFDSSLHFLYDRI